MIEGVGIDFGTGTSALALIREAGAAPRFVKPYATKDGMLYMESAAAYDDTVGQIVTGRRAQRINILALAAGEKTCFPIKPHMGKEARFRLHEADYSPQELTAYVLAKLVRRAANQEVLPIDVILQAPAVITYPADADEAQRQATLDAARLVGFTKVFGMAEPHAAAYTYVMHNREFVLARTQKTLDELRAKRQALEMDARAKPSEKAVLTKRIEEAEADGRTQLQNFYARIEGRPFLVYDFGAGTFDAIVGEIRRDESGTLAFNILGRDGRKRVGGHYLSDEFTVAILKRLQQETKQVPALSPEAKYQLFEYADEKKIQLSEDASVDVFTKLRLNDKAITIDQKWDRVRFKNDVLDRTLDQTLEVCKNAVREAVEKTGKLKGIEDVRHIFLVGGSSRIPFVRSRLQEVFRKSLITDLRNLAWDAGEISAAADIGPTTRFPEEVGDPMTAVAGGAAIAAAMFRQAERTGQNDGRTFLETLGVSSRSNFSVWWNTGGDRAGSFELVCDRGEQLPLSYKEEDIWPQDPRARTVAWSIWQSPLSAKELHERRFPAEQMTEIGRIVLRQNISDQPRRIQLTIHVSDEGEVSVEALQDLGEQYEGSTKLPSVFTPTATLSREEFETAKKRVQAYLEAPEVI